MSDASCPRGGEEKYRLLLQVSEAANGQLELSGVLGAVARALKPFVPVDAIGVASTDGEVVRLRAIHIEGVERRPGEPFADVMSRALHLSADQLAQISDGLPFHGSGTEFVG